MTDGELAREARFFSDQDNQQQRASAWTAVPGIADRIRSTLDVDAIEHVVGLARGRAAALREEASCKRVSAWKERMSQDMLSNQSRIFSGAELST